MATWFDQQKAAGGNTGVIGPNSGAQGIMAPRRTAEDERLMQTRRSGRPSATG